jgi:uncharacterized RmlC-like cupin family protein
MAEKFEAWGIVELMGHQRAAGRLSEQTIGGANLLRVDIPHGEGFRTAFYGSSAIYAVHITDETIARAAASAHGTRPTYAYEVSDELRKLAAPRSPASYAAQVEDQVEDEEEQFDFDANR